MSLLSSPSTGPLRVAYHSDLHLERSSVSLDTSGADVVILAGDILEAERATPDKRQTVIDVIGKRLVPDDDTPVIFVPGNHDLVSNRWRDAISIWKEISRKRYGERIHILVNEAWEYKGVQFLGTPLWTDFSAHGTQEASMFAAKNGVGDFSTIFNDDGKLISPQDWLEEHGKARNFLDRHLRRQTIGAGMAKESPGDMPQVVVTHWCPSTTGVQGARFQTNKVLAPYWVSNDDDLVARASTWIFGHTHWSVDARVGTNRHLGRLTSNARGSFSLAEAHDVGWQRKAILDIERPTQVLESRPAIATPKPRP